MFFVIPVIATLIPVIGFARPFYRWLHVRRIDKWHRALGNLERELAQSTDRSRLIKLRRELLKLKPPYGCSRSRAPSRPICTASGSICAWFEKTFAEWER